MLSITSRENEKVKEYCALCKSASARRQAQQFCAEGARLVRDLATKLPPVAVYLTQSALDAAPQLGTLCEQTYVVHPSVAEKLSDTKTTQGVFGVFPMPPAAENIGDVARVLVLENVQDPANVGTLLRSAAAFGFEVAVLGEGSADAFSPKAVRASMSAVAGVRLVQGANVPAVCAQLRADGTQVLAAALYHSVSLGEVDTAAMEKIALLIGNEGAGLTDAAVTASSQAVRIPMTDAIESLNAAAAGSVLLWHCRKVGL